jgi:hypothetical protein
MKIYTEDQWYVTDGKRCNLADTLSHRRRQKLYGSNPVFISARCRKAALHKYRQEEKMRRKNDYL